MDIFGCLEPGCDAPADAEPSRPAGTDDQGRSVWLKRIHCCGGHWYDIEAIHATDPAQG